MYDTILQRASICYSIQCCIPFFHTNVQFYGGIYYLFASGLDKEWKCIFSSVAKDSVKMARKDVSSFLTFLRDCLMKWEPPTNVVVFISLSQAVDLCMRSSVPWKYSTTLSDICKLMSCRRLDFTKFPCPHVNWSLFASQCYLPRVKGFNTVGIG